MTTITAAKTAKAHGQPVHRPKLVLFYSPRSGQSRRLDGYLAQVLQHRGNHATFAILRIDVDERPDLATRFKITTLPTLLVIDGNRIRARLHQPHGCKEITELLRPWLT
jgi:thioredoxin-like negative regulator of GroEL